jgi:beta-lactamase superfamily II metal-dependent hydrolase
MRISVQKRIAVQAPDVLKVGHHGSAYASSPAFVAAVRPRYALISAGRHNLFGHPAPVTVQTLEDAGAAVLRTDRCGAITIRVDAAIALTTMLACEKPVRRSGVSDAAPVRAPAGTSPAFGPGARIDYDTSS